MERAVIRLAKAADAPAVRMLVDAAYSHYVERLGKRPGPMLDDYERRIAAGQAWVLVEGGEIVGLVVLEEQADRILLDNIAVAPAAQGKGWGKTLMRFAEREAARRGYVELQLYTHVLMVENIALYGRLGYREIERVSEKGFERVYMAKSL
jgi:ribosomal protein S18 acetylase RimI-like enzyme